MEVVQAAREKPRKKRGGGSRRTTGSTSSGLSPAIRVGDVGSGTGPITSSADGAGSGSKRYRNAMQRATTVCGDDTSMVTVAGVTEPGLTRGYPWDHSVAAAATTKGNPQTRAGSMKTCDQYAHRLAYMLAAACWWHAPMAAVTRTCMPNENTDHHHPGHHSPQLVLTHARACSSPHVSGIRRASPVRRTDGPHDERRQPSLPPDAADRPKARCASRRRTTRNRRLMMRAEV